MIATPARPRNIIAKAFALCVSIFVTQAFPVDYHVSFDGIVDNREYGVRSDYPTLVDNTVLLTRGAADARFAVHDEHKIVLGLAWSLEFAFPKRPLDFALSLPLLYYLHESEILQFRFGIFPRAGIFDAPVWLYGEDNAYFRPNILGAALKTGAIYGASASAWVDWTGHRSEETRESFLFGYGLKYERGIFFAKNDFLMYHLALPLNPPPDMHVMDNGGISAEAGAAIGKTAYLDTAALSAGAIASLDRDRGDNVWHNPIGGFVSGFIGSGALAMRGFYYNGQAQRIRWGSNLYAYSGMESFARADAILRFNKKENVNAELFASFYLFGNGKVGTSQHFILRAEYMSEKKRAEKERAAREAKENGGERDCDCGKKKKRKLWFRAGWN
jgi:hypothetical protein